MIDNFVADIHANQGKLKAATLGMTMQEGYEKEAKELIKKTWENASVNVLNPWNQPDMYSSTDGSYLFGDHEMRNMVIWSVLFNMAKKDKGIEAFLKGAKK